MIAGMASATSLSKAEYLHASDRPDREYVEVSCGGDTGEGGSTRACNGCWPSGSAMMRGNGT